MDHEEGFADSPAQRGPPDWLIARNEIVGISDLGLVLEINGREDVAPWSAISKVIAVMPSGDRTSDRRIPTLVFGIMTGANERVFTLEESEPLWAALTATLPDVLQGMPRSKIWRAELAASRIVSLYNRGDRAR